MMMSMNEKKILFTFGCPKRELTVERLRHAAALAVDPTANEPDNNTGKFHELTEAEMQQLELPKEWLE